MNTNKYDAQRALNELDVKRAMPDWAGDTGMFPRIPQPLRASDETVPALPALVRKQAE